MDTYIKSKIEDDTIKQYRSIIHRKDILIDQLLKESTKKDLLINNLLEELKKLSDDMVQIIKKL